MQRLTLSSTAASKCDLSQCLSKPTNGAQDAGEAVHEDGVHAQRSGNGARVLPARAAKARQHMRRHIVALQHYHRCERQA